MKTRITFWWCSDCILHRIYSALERERETKSDALLKDYISRSTSRLTGNTTPDHAPIQRYKKPSQNIQVWIISDLQTDPVHQVHKIVQQEECLSAAAGLFWNSVYMLCMVWLVLANLMCHAALSDGKHMSTEERKPIHTAALTWSRYSKASHVFLVYYLLLSTVSYLYLLFPRNSICHVMWVNKQTGRNQLFTSGWIWFQKSVKY